MTPRRTTTRPTPISSVLIAVPTGSDADRSVPRCGRLGLGHGRRRGGSGWMRSSCSGLLNKIDLWTDEGDVDVRRC